VSDCGLCSDRLMKLARSSESLSQHPFAGCNRLLEQYRMIGRGLLACERGACAPLIPSARNLRDFSAAVSFVPVEVLETYLDDLLDLGVSDESLFIKKPKLSWRGRTLLTVLATALVGALCAWHGDLTKAVMPALLAVTFLAGIASTMYLLPRTKAIRRFSFATVVSREIGQRRGQGKSDVGNFATRLLMGEMWKLNDYPATRSMPAHSARAGVRYYH
jgi:hypothetical protein